MAKQLLWLYFIIGFGFMIFNGLAGNPVAMETKIFVVSILAVIALVEAIEKGKSTS